MKISPRFSLLRQLAWAATLATGFGTVWFMLVIWLATSIQDSWQGRKGKWPDREQLVVKSDGSLLVQVNQWKDNYSPAISYRDLNGGQQASPEQSDLVPGLNPPGKLRTSDEFIGDLGWEQRLTEFFSEKEPTVNWFFVHDGKADGAGYFVGYERESNRRVGFIGLAGARPDPVPVSEWIPVRGALVLGNLQWSSLPFPLHPSQRTSFRTARWDLPPRLVYVPSGNIVREVDLSTGTVKTAFEGPEPIDSLAIPRVESWSGGHYTKEPPVLVRTRQAIYALDRSHKVIRRFAIPTEFGPESAVTWYEIGNGQAIADFLRPASSAEPSGLTSQNVYRIAADGAIQQTIDLSLRSGSPANNNASVQMQALCGLPSPAFLLVIEPLLLMEDDPNRSYFAALLAVLGKLWPPLLAVFALSLVLAMIAWRRCRAFGLQRREHVAWSIFVLLLGLPAFAGFLLCRRWPVRLPCMTCHALAPRDRPLCATCGSPLPEPSLLGIEVFA
jgi:hypothetical protein